MKKTSKILILVLSLALVFGMLAIVSGAESESVVLTQDTVDAANGVINFESDVTVESVINLNGDLTLNLNGYTLTVENGAYFKYVANSNFTVNGPD